jgi:hypothetical protein
MPESIGNTTWEQEWRRMQLWLFAGFMVIVLGAGVAYVFWLLGAWQASIVAGLVGAVVDLAMIARATWSYVRVMKLRAAERAIREPNSRNREWLLAIAFLLVPLTLYTLWYVLAR